MAHPKIEIEMNYILHVLVYYVLINVSLCFGDSHEPFDFEKMAARSDVIAIVSIENSKSEEMVSDEMSQEFYRRYVSAGKVLWVVKGCEKGNTISFEHFRLRKPLVNHSSLPKFDDATNRKLDEMPDQGLIELPSENNVYLVFLRKKPDHKVFQAATGNSNAAYSFHRLDGKNDEELWVPSKKVSK